ncbi:MAG: exodeoxyribonuclease VII large subunit [Erysipelothrix sp.]|nr:exodeoxyribonuclease VII large subunit [Erysipelothrix sp.]
MSQKWSVKSLVAYLKLKLDNDFLIQNINVVGELSNFKYHNNRHMYFTLKDEVSRVSCVMFATNARQVNFNPKDGMLVSLKANVSIFESSGSLQLYVTEMNEEGAGDLSARFELLKKQLNAEGLFAEQHKQGFKKFPSRIAVVSGKDSAALNDILTTLERRWPIATVNVYPSLVQGPEAHLDLISNLIKIDNQDYDAIILARGGGSIEDLWAFNEESLARVIYNLKTPIISGVGHEIDFTISDFVADLRAPTPTAAAELITPNITDVKASFKQYENSLKERMNYQLNNASQLVYTYSNMASFKHPELLTATYQKALRLNADKLQAYQSRFIENINKYKLLEKSIIASANDIINIEVNKTALLKQELYNNINLFENKLKANFSNQLQLLDSYSPINTLKRGYSIVEHNDQIIKSVKDININDEIKVALGDGHIIASVIGKEENDGKL